MSARAAPSPTQPGAAGAERGTRVLDRSLAMLFELGAADGALPIAELARRAQLPQSTTYRLVDELERHGLVERDDGGLGLGLRLLELARRVEDRLAPALLEPARGIMRALARECDEHVGTVARRLLVERLEELGAEVGHGAERS